VKPFNHESARAVLDIARDFQEKMLKAHGTRFVFPSDEMLLIAGEEIPPEEEYEDYPQIENGVGLLRKFEESLKYAAGENTQKAIPRKIRIACGASIAPVMEKWMSNYAPEGVQVTVQKIRNFFFGESITVTGLLTGGDLKNQLQDATDDEILLCSNTLREEQDLFLDDMPLGELKNALNPKLTIVPNDGAALYAALLGHEI